MIHPAGNLVDLDCLTNKGLTVVESTDLLLVTRSPSSATYWANFRTLILATCDFGGIDLSAASLFPVIIVPSYTHLVYNFHFGVHECDSISDFGIDILAILD